MVKSVNRTLRFPESVRYLHRREAYDVPEDQNFALLVGQLFKGLAEIPAALETDLVMAIVASPDFFRRHSALCSQVIQGRIAGDAQYPCGERHLPLLVLADNRDQLGEDVLRDVLGFVMILDKAPHIAEYVIRVADVKEVKGLHVAFLGACHRFPDEETLIVAPAGEPR